MFAKVCESQLCSYIATLSYCRDIWNGRGAPINPFSHVVVMLTPWNLKMSSGQIHSTGLILGLRPADERRRYFVTTSLIGWAQSQWETVLLCNDVSDWLGASLYVVVRFLPWSMRSLATTPWDRDDTLPKYAGSTSDFNIRLFRVHIAPIRNPQRPKSLKNQTWPFQHNIIHAPVHINVFREACATPVKCTC